MKFFATLLFVGMALAAAAPAPAPDAEDMVGKHDAATTRFRADASVPEQVEKRCHAKDQYCAANSICCSGTCIGAGGRFGGYCK